MRAQVPTCPHICHDQTAASPHIKSPQACPWAASEHPLVLLAPWTTQPGSIGVPNPGANEPSTHPQIVPRTHDKVTRALPQPLHLRLMDPTLTTQAGPKDLVQVTQVLPDPPVPKFMDPAPPTQIDPGTHWTYANTTQFHTENMSIHTFWYPRTDIEQILCAYF